mmetsp:Transcript_22735/g.43481  ORF Transcript_22735/g.43481 Transcript_22735/m.43481 type:complete len:230 (+) Transcript_22735:1587-2276(+)
MKMKRDADVRTREMKPFKARVVVHRARQTRIRASGVEAEHGLSNRQIGELARRRSLHFGVRGGGCKDEAGAQRVPVQTGGEPVAGARSGDHVRAAAGGGVVEGGRQDERRRQGLGRGMRRGAPLPRRARWAGRSEGCIHRQLLPILYAKTHAVLRRVVEAGVVCVGELTPGCFFGQLLSTKRKPYDFEIYSNNQLRPCTKTESAQGRGNVTSSKLFDFTAHSRKSSSTR